MKRKVLSLMFAAAMIFAVLPCGLVNAEGLTQYSTVSLGAGHSGVIKNDGSLWMWGFNSAGQLGNGARKVSSATPIKVMDNVATVSLGSYHSAAIKTDGSLWMWGDNKWGQLGDGTQNYSAMPIKVMDNVATVSLGDYNSAAIKNDGSLWMWGGNYSGELGNGTEYYSTTPTKVMDNVSTVSLGSYHSAAIKTDGSLWMWGGNYLGVLGNGVLGDGTQNASATPIKVMDNVSTVSLGDYNSAAIKSDGSLWIWGGQLGNGTENDSATPMKIMDNVSTVSLGSCHSAAIKTDGSLWMWGQNWHGKLGNGTKNDSTTPIKVMDNVATVSLGTHHSAAIKTDGSLWMWGTNVSGELGNGTEIDSATPIKIMDNVMLPQNNIMTPTQSETTNIQETNTKVEYEYDDNYNKTISIENIVDDVGTIDEAVSGLQTVVDNMTDDEKSKAENIDLITKLKEEMIAKISVKSADNDIVINDEFIADGADEIGALTEKLNKALQSAGIKEQRKTDRMVSIYSDIDDSLKINKENISKDIDSVRVRSNFASVVFDKDSVNSMEIKNAGGGKVNVSFDTDKTSTVKVSFPMTKNDTDYYAVVDEKGNPIGGKYNPATGEIEAKIDESGIYSVVYNEKDFNDIKDKANEMQNAIKVLASKGIINGTSETTFSPDDSISRAEVAALVVRTLSKLDPNEDGRFADVTRSNWYFGTAGSSKKYGIINGYEDNTFRGENVIAKDQIVVVAARALRNEMGYYTPDNIGEYLNYSDSADIAAWAKEDVAVATMANIVLKRVDGVFGGETDMTRGDAAIILYRLFMKIW